MQGHVGSRKCIQEVALIPCRLEVFRTPPEPVFINESEKLSPLHVAM